MNILICPDSFKGTLSSIEVAKIIGEVFSEAHHTCVLQPIADGGEGTVETLLFALGGEKISVMVRNPLGREKKAFYGLSGKKAFIEMAEASGLCCIKESERNPFITTTYGVGELLKDALDRDVEEIYLGVGGSATNDVGIGMAQAMGIRFLDKNGKEISEGKEQGYGASALSLIDSIDTKALDKRIFNIKLHILCDVQNPLYGEHGASFVYAPQKGADETMVKKLEASVKHFANILEKTYQIDPNFPGAGASGGLGAGLKLFFGGEVVSGIEGMIQFMRLEEKMKNADLIIVGEGQMDYQSFFGKAPIGIAKLAKKFHKKVVAFVGKIGKDVEKNFEYVDHIFSCYGKEEIDFETVKAKSHENLKNLSRLALSKLPNISSESYQLTFLS